MQQNDFSNHDTTTTNNDNNKEPVKLSVEPEMKTRPWLLPCGRLVGDVRRRSGPASPTPGPTPPPLPPLLLRVGAFVGCVGVSEMLRLPADLIADYTR